MRSCSCCSPDLSDDVSSLASMLKVISEPNRLRILCVLQNGEEHCVCELAEHIKDVSQSLLSHHLADLRDSGLIVGEKRGLRVYYRLTGQGKDVTGKVLSSIKKGVA